MDSSIPHAATHTSLDIFQKPPILVNFESGNVQDIYPVGPVDGANIEFNIQTDRHVYVDLQNIFLEVTYKVVVDNNKNLDEEDVVYMANNTLHSLFSNVDVSLNNELVSSSNGHYAHKAMIQTEISHTRSTKEALLECQGYSYEPEPRNFGHETIKNRHEKTKNSQEHTVFGKLAVDLFNCDKLLIPNSAMRITMIKSNPNFCLITTTNVPNPADNVQGKPKYYSVKFLRAKLHVRQMNVTEPIHRSINNALAKGPARYTYPEINPKTFIIPAGQNSFIKENVFNNAPIRRIAIAMNTNADFTGSLASNPYHYQKFDLREIKIYRNGQPLIICNTEQNVRPFHQTLTSLNFLQDGPGISLSEFEDHFYLVFDLTIVGQPDTEIYYPEVVGAGIRVELFFKQALSSTVEVIILGKNCQPF